MMTLAALFCAALMVTVAAAEAALYAYIDGDALVVRWQGVAGEANTLTVSRDGWPMVVGAVKGASGERRYPLPGKSGTYTARLNTDGGCLLAAAKAGDTPVNHSQEAETAIKPDYTAPASFAAGLDALAGQVVAQVNAERARAGLSALRVDGELTRAARIRAEEIAKVFSHTRPDGSSWSTVSAGVYGENIAMGQKTADKVMAAWLTSEGHRANILRPGFGSIGVCAYRSGGVLYWVQLFGK